VDKNIGIGGGKTAAATPSLKGFAKQKLARAKGGEAAKSNKREGFHHGNLSQGRAKRPKQAGLKSKGEREERPAPKENLKEERKRKSLFGPGGRPVDQARA